MEALVNDARHRLAIGLKDSYFKCYGSCESWGDIPLQDILQGGIVRTTAEYGRTAGRPASTAVSKADNPTPRQTQKQHLREESAR